MLHLGFILERGLTGFPQFGKKMPHKIYVAASNGAQKNRPKDKYYSKIPKISPPNW